MTEATGGITMTPPREYIANSVGRSLPGIELKIEDDGELCMKGPYVSSGVYKIKDSESFKDGWFYTGDVGKVDEDGFVFITGRKKEIYVSSAGKNIAPLVIEETMKSIPVISQCMLIGDNRKYCSALFTLDVGAILRDIHGLDGATEVPKDPNEQLSKLKELGHDLSEYTSVGSDVHKQLEQSVQELNQRFSNPEQIKKFTILPRDLNIDEGELTPTLKIRRKQIRENWANEIESMYADA